VKVLLETERLILRRFAATDADNLFALDSDPEVMRFLTGGTPTPREVVEHEILPRFLRYDARSRCHGFWAAIDKATGDFLGWFSFQPFHDVPDDAMLGYRLRKAAWGKGYATEGVQALIDVGFTESSVRRVVATTYQDNLASRRVMEKLEMRLVRTFRVTPDDLVAAGTFHVTSPELWDGDDVEYALERDAWERQQESMG
jgi:RimJ/RimL family protein N-acetyltransferase